MTSRHRASLGTLRRRRETEGRRTSQSRGGPVHLNSNEAHLGIYELKLASSTVLFLRGPSAQVSSPPFLFILFRVVSTSLQESLRVLFIREMSLFVRILVLFSDSIADVHSQEESFLNDNCPITSSDALIASWIVVSFVMSLVIFERCNIKLVTKPSSGQPSSSSVSDHGSLCGSFSFVKVG